MYLQLCTGAKGICRKPPVYQVLDLGSRGEISEHAHAVCTDRRNFGFRGWEEIQELVSRGLCPVKPGLPFPTSLDKVGSPPFKG